MPVKLPDLKTAMANARKHDFGALPRKVQSYPKLPIERLDTLPVPGLNSIFYKGLVRSASTKEVYNVSIQFFDVIFKEEKFPSSLVAEFNGKLLYYPKPSVRTNGVKLYCKCSDYRFRFEKPNFDRKGQIGAFRRYTRLTPPPPAGYPYANPQNVPGYCKHVNSLLLALNSAGLVGN